jgi:hypothetical protein
MENTINLIKFRLHKKFPFLPTLALSSPCLRLPASTRLGMMKGNGAKSFAFFVKNLFVKHLLFT